MKIGNEMKRAGAAVEPPTNTLPPARARHSPRRRRPARDRPPPGLVSPLPEGAARGGGRGDGGDPLLQPGPLPRRGRRERAGPDLPPPRDRGGRRRLHRRDLGGGLPLPRGAPDPPGERGAFGGAQRGAGAKQGRVRGGFGRGRQAAGGGFGGGGEGAGGPPAVRLRLRSLGQHSNGWIASSNLTPTS